MLGVQQQDWIRVLNTILVFTLQTFRCTDGLATLEHKQAETLGYFKLDP